MKVSMILKLVAMSSAAVGTQAALLCTSDAFCATADSSKPHCIYTSDTASACQAALLASGVDCFVKSTKDLKQCAITDFCDYGHATLKKCKTKIAAGTAAGNAAVGTTAAEKAHSCKSGEAGTTNCETVSDAGCTAEAGSAQYLVKPSVAGAAACTATLIANGADCFQISTKATIQCAATDFCDYGHASLKKCKTKIAAGTAAANAAVGTTAAEKAHSCKSGEAGTTNCETVSDAGCTAEAGSAQYYVSSSTSAAACQAAAGLLATGAGCFKISTKATIQCATTDFCNYGAAAAADKKCTPKIAAGTAAANAAVGGTDDEKKHSCVSGEVGSDGKCATASDAGCTAEAGSAKYYVKPNAAGAAACVAAGIAADADCFQISTDAANQCVSTHTCFAADGKCKNPTNDADCKAAIASKPFYVKATATGASACAAAGLAKDAQCFIKTTAAANQCADGHYCPATTDAATNKCAALVATGGDCTAGGAIACQSGICTSNKCVAIADAAACTKVTTATFNQCLAASYCPATSSVATNKCIGKLAKDGDCTTIGGIACKSNTCTSNKCVDSSAPTTSPTKATKAPSKAPTKADHSDASAITASSFVVAATVFASSMFA